MKELELLLQIIGKTYPQTNKIKRETLDRLALKLKLEMVQLSRQLVDGKITAAMWQRGMEDLINDGHTSAVVLWAEGPENLTVSHRLAIEESKRREKTFLIFFLADYLAGKVSDNQLPARAGSYGVAIRRSYYDVARTDAAQQGFDLEENVLNPADHCSGPFGCPAQTALGVVPVGTLIPIGQRACMSNCMCNIRQINSTTGEVRII